MNALLLFVPALLPFRSFNWVTYFQGMPEDAHTPLGEMDGGEKDWIVYPLHRLMSTFSLGTVSPDAGIAGLRFVSPRTLMRLDVYNPTDKVITLTLRAPEMREVAFEPAGKSEPLEFRLNRVISVAYGLTTWPTHPIYGLG